MQTIHDIPDELYRALKARAALRGVPMREVVTQLIELGLQSASSGAPARNRRDAVPPVAIPARGMPIAALSHEGKVRLEEIEDEARMSSYGRARPARRPDLLDGSVWLPDSIPNATD